MKTNTKNEMGSVRMLVGLAIGFAASLCVLEYGKPFLGEKQTASIDWDTEDVIELEIPITRTKTEPPKPVEPVVQTKKVLLASIDPSMIITDPISELPDEDLFADFTLDIDEAAFKSVEEPELEAPAFFLPSEDMPQFPGGEKGLLNYLGSAVKYPALLRDMGMEGMVYVKFIVGKDGKVEEESIEITRSPHAQFSQEAIEAVLNMPQWTPGKQRGKPVRVYYNLPIKFALK